MIQSIRSWFNRDRSDATVERAIAPPASAEPTLPERDAAAPATIHLDLAIASNDPLLAYLQQSASVVDVGALRLESPALDRLREAGVRLIVPLVSQSELLGIISLGPRRSDQEYSSDDRRLLADLASRAAPSVRVAQLVRQQQLETQERERIDAELRVARIIQETLLPKQLPQMEDYSISAYWQPARAVGGDFYDFIRFDDGRLALIVGDVTDKGVPAALVMSTTRTVLRATAERVQNPGEVLERANAILHLDIPSKMYITCLYAILDPTTGLIRYANAGHDLPYLRTANGVVEMRATGMPLGLLPDMHYEEKEVTLRAGETVVFYSDGIVEAHNAERDMFSFRRLRELVGQHEGGADMIPFLLDQLNRFTGEEWEQEDDVTIVTLQRHVAASGDDETPGTAGGAFDDSADVVVSHSVEPPQGAEVLADFSIESAPGNERQAMRRVATAVGSLGMDKAQLERLKTAVAEATMNAMEHGNRYSPHLKVAIQVFATPAAVIVRITDHGGGRPIPDATDPDLDAKLAGLQSPRGWGLFLIRNLVDHMETTTDDVHHIVEFTVLRREPTPGDEPPAKPEPPARPEPPTKPEEAGDE